MLEVRFLVKTSDTLRMLQLLQLEARQLPGGHGFFAPLQERLPPSALEVPKGQHAKMAFWQPLNDDLPGTPTILAITCRSPAMKPWFAAALISASLAGCATAPPGPNANASSNSDYPVVTQDANGVPVEPVPRRAPRVGLGIGLGSWGGRGFGGVGIGLGF